MDSMVDIFIRLLSLRNKLEGREKQTTEKRGKGVRTVSVIRIDFDILGTGLFFEKKKRENAVAKRLIISTNVLFLGMIYVNDCGCCISILLSKPQLIK